MGSWEEYGPGVTFFPWYTSGATFFPWDTSGVTFFPWDVVGDCVNLRAPRLCQNQPCCNECRWPNARNFLIMLRNIESYVLHMESIGCYVPPWQPSGVTFFPWYTSGATFFPWDTSGVTFFPWYHLGPYSSHDTIWSHILPMIRKHWVIESKADKAISHLKYFGSSISRCISSEKLVM